MTTEEIAIMLANHDQRIIGAEHRLKDLEETQKQIFNLTVSVKELAISVKNMVEEQKAQGERIQKLEEEPGSRYRHLRKTLVTSVVSAIGGAIGVGIIALIASSL